MRRAVPPIVLVVEDEEPVRRLIAETLREDGYFVVSVGNADDALRELRREDVEFDLIVLDVVMPGMSGEAVARFVRQEPDLRSLPILAVTALTSVADAARVLEAGANAYLSKPFHLHELRELAARLIRDRIRGAAR